MAAAQDRLSGGQLRAALPNEIGKPVADFSRGKVRNVWKNRTGETLPHVHPHGAYAFWRRRHHRLRVKSITRVNVTRN